MTHSNDTMPTSLPSSSRPGADHTPTVGELDLEARSSLRRLSRSSNVHTTEQSDGYDVEYRKLRLEKVVLVAVWTEGSTAQIEASLAELRALAETAGSEVADMLYQRRDKPDSATFSGPGRSTSCVTSSSRPGPTPSSSTASSAPGR